MISQPCGDCKGESAGLASEGDKAGTADSNAVSGEGEGTAVGMAHGQNTAQLHFVVLCQQQFQRGSVQRQGTAGGGSGSSCFNGASLAS